MEESSGTERMQLTSDITHHSKTESNRDCKIVNESFLTSKCSNTTAKKLSSKAVKDKYEPVADVEQCPEGHICYKCNSSSTLFADSSIFYGAQDYVPSRSFIKTRSTYSSEAVVDQYGADLRGNIWLGSYHY